jgi:hypothetical protein
MIQLNILRACFENLSKHALSFCLFIKVISINLIKHYSKATVEKSSEFPHDFLASKLEFLYKEGNDSIKMAKTIYMFITKNP